MECTRRLDEISQMLMLLHDGLDHYTVVQLRYMLATKADVLSRAACTYRLRLLEKMQELEATIQSIDRIVHTRLILNTESEVLGGMSEGAVTTLHENENLGDVTGADVNSFTTGVQSDTTVGARHMNNVDEYFARPVQIYKGSLAVGSDWSIRLSVWDLLTTQPSVRSKLRNYAFLRANLKVRIAISGTPFHLGKVLLSYQPYANLNPSLTNLLSAVSTSVNNRPLLLNYLSQAEGSTVMDVRDNAPVEIFCPFISTKPMHRLYNITGTAISGSFTDLIDAGDLFIYTINSLAGTQTSPTSIYIQAYAWLEDVELGTNTATQLVITTESSNLDERKVGPVERIASRIAVWSSTLIEVPEVGVFATATTIAAGAVAAVAAIFGWSKPIMDSNPEYNKIIPYSNTASTIGGSVASKISTDPHQELSVNTHFAGVTEDQLVISNIAKRRSYLTTFNWATTDTSMGSSIWNCRVHPNLNTVRSATRYYVQPTAMAFAVAPFQYWRGDIIFRFEIVCSAFHRGKLAIYFEPNCNQYTLINAALSLNKQFIKIIDIQETQTVDIRVPWASMRSWLKNQTAAFAAANTVINNPTYYAEGFCNGYIGVVPFTNLQSPNSQGVKVNVYVSSDNLRVNGPTDSTIPETRHLIAESSNLDADWSPSCHVLEDVSEIDLNLSSASEEHISEDHFGEEVLSFRSLLKRYMSCYNQTTAANATRNILVIERPIYENIMCPYNTTSAAKMDLVSYLRYAFLGMRGSMRKIITTNLPQSSLNSMAPVRMSLLAPSSSNASTWAGYTPDTTPVVPWSGTIPILPALNGGVEVDLPHFSNNLYVYSFNNTTDDTSGQESMERTWYRNYRFELSHALNTADALTSNINIMQATGEDFNFVRFLGAPFYSAPTIA